MQPGTLAQGQKNTYTVQASIGEPGLYGIAYRAVAPDGTSVVIKALRADRPLEDKDRVVAEVQTLRRVAVVEDANQSHYAVRLIDESRPESTPPFIVMELATGQNVLDLVGRVMDWEHAPLAESTVLTIAREFAQAIHYAHEAGICYDDMKLDNLFWDASRPDGNPLRIIDWNVVSDVQTRGVNGDWARFGARLYEMLTGQYLGISRDGDVEGAVERAARWPLLPYGLRSIINRALNPQSNLRYQSDSEVLADLDREIDIRTQPLDEILRRGRVAAGGKQWEIALAAIDRAKRMLEEQDTPDERMQAQISQLQTEIEYGAGRARSNELDSGKRLLSRNEYGLAVERLQSVFTSVQGRDSRARWWLWLAELAHEQGAKWYASFRDELEAGVNALEQSEFPGAAKSFGLLLRQTSLPLIKTLSIEALARSKEAKLLTEKPNLTLDDQILRLKDVLEKISEIKESFAQYADLNEWHTTLQSKLRLLERQRDRAEKQARQIAAVEKQMQLGDSDYAQQRWEAALATYAAARVVYATLIGDQLPGSQVAQTQAALAHLDLHSLVAQLEIRLAQKAPLPAIERLYDQLYPLTQQLPAATVQSLQQRIQTMRDVALELHSIQQANETLSQVKEHLNQCLTRFDLQAIQAISANLATIQTYNDLTLLERVEAIQKRAANLAAQFNAAEEVYQAASTFEQYGNYAEAHAAYQQAALAAPSFIWLADKVSENARLVQVEAELAQINQLLHQATEQADLAAMQKAQHILYEIDLPPGSSQLATAYDTTQQHLQTRLHELTEAAAVLADFDQSALEDLALARLGQNHQALIRARTCAPSISSYAQAARRHAAAIVALLTQEHSRLRSEVEAEKYKTPLSIETVQAISQQVATIIKGYPLAKPAYAGDSSWARPADLEQFKQGLSALLSEIADLTTEHHKRQRELSQFLHSADTKLIGEKFEEALRDVVQAREQARSQAEIDQVAALRLQITAQKQAYEQRDLERQVQRQVLDEQTKKLTQIEEYLHTENFDQAGRVLGMLERDDIHATLLPRFDSLKQQSDTAQSMLALKAAPALIELSKSNQRSDIDREAEWSNATAPLSQIDSAHWHTQSAGTHPSIHPAIEALIEAKQRLDALSKRGLGGHEIALIDDLLQCLQPYQQLLRRDPRDIAPFQVLAETLPNLRATGKDINKNSFSKEIKHTFATIISQVIAVAQAAQDIAELRGIVDRRRLSDKAAHNAVRYEQANDLAHIFKHPAIQYLAPELGEATRFIEAEEFLLADLAQSIEAQWRSDAAVQQYEREAELWTAAFGVIDAQDCLHDLKPSARADHSDSHSAAVAGLNFWPLVRRIRVHKDQFKAAVECKAKWMAKNPVFEIANATPVEWQHLANELERFFSSLEIKALDAEVLNETTFFTNERQRLNTLRVVVEQDWVGKARPGTFSQAQDLFPIAVAVLKAEHSLATLERSAPPPLHGPGLRAAIKMLADGDSTKTLWMVAALPEAERDQFDKTCEIVGKELLIELSRTAKQEQSDAKKAARGSAKAHVKK